MKTVTPPLQKRAVLLHSSDTAIYLSTYPSIHLSSGIAVARRGQYGDSSNTETQRRLSSSEATQSFAQGFTDRPFGASFHLNIAPSIVITNGQLHPGARATRSEGMELAPVEALVLEVQMGKRAENGFKWESFVRM